MTLAIGTPTPIEVRLDIYRGDDLATYVRLYQIVDDVKTYLDLTGTEVLAQIRRSPDTEVVVALTAVPTLPQTGDDLGRIDLSLTAAATAVLPTGVYRWDLQLVADTTRTRARGAAIVTADISHPDA